MSRWGIFLPVAALVCAIDQASKWWIVKHMTLESVITQYLTTVKPMHYIFVEPTKYNADIVIDGEYRTAIRFAVEPRNPIVPSEQ